MDDKPKSNQPSKLPNRELMHQLNSLYLEKDIAKRKCLFDRLVENKDNEYIQYHINLLNDETLENSDKMEKQTQENFKRIDKEFERIEKEAKENARKMKEATEEATKLKKKVKNIKKKLRN